MEPFDRVYFDTNVLFEERWPRPKPNLLQIFSDANALKVELFIPEAVDVEHENLWLREILASVDKLAERTQAIVTESILSRPSQEHLRQDYRTAVSKAKEKWGVQPVGFFQQTLAAAFQEAVPNDPNLESRPGEFRDTILYISVREHLRMNPPQQGAVIISRDGGIARIHNSDRRQWQGIKTKLQISKLLEVQAELQKRRSQIVQTTEYEWRERNDQSVRDALLAERNRLEAFLATNLISPVDHYPGSLRQVKLEDVNTVATSALPGTTDSETVEINANLDVSITSGFPFEEEGFIATPRGPVFGPGFLRQYKANVRLEAIGTLRGGRYDDLQFKVRSSIGPNCNKVPERNNEVM